MNRDLIEITTSVYKNNTADYGPPYYFYKSRESEADEPAPGWNVRIKKRVKFLSSVLPIQVRPIFSQCFSNDLGILLQTVSFRARPG
jgi:hypothetical protein